MTCRLSELPAGHAGTIVRLEGGRGMTKQLEDIGIEKDKHVSVIAKQPGGGPLVVRIGTSTVSIGRGKADRIIVTPDEP